MPSPSEGPRLLSLAATIAHQTIMAIERGEAATSTEGALVVQVIAFVRHGADLGVLDEVLIATRDRLSRPGRGPADRTRSTLDWIDLIYPVLLAGHPVPPRLDALLAAPDPGTEADATRREALGEAAFRQMAAAQRRGDGEQELAWQRLAHENGHPLAVAVFVRRRPMVDLSVRGRDPRIAALLNVSGVAAGYLYLGRWKRAVAALVATALVLWFAATHSASQSPGLWIAVAVLGVGATTFDAWRLARPPHAMAVRGPLPRRPVVTAATLVLLIFAGFLGYQAAGRSALADARAAHAAGDCPAALDRYASVQARYELTLTSVTADARVDQRECRDLLDAESSSDPGWFDAQLDRYPAGLLVARARAGRAEAYLQRGKSYNKMAAEQADGVDAAELRRKAFADFEKVVTGHPGTAQAAAVASELDTAYASVIAEAQGQPCPAVAELTYLGTVSLPQAKAGAARARAARPDALYNCGLKEIAGREYDSAIGYLDRFITDYPRDSRVAQARQKRIAAEVAKVRAGATGDIAPLERTGDGPAGTAIVQVVNDSPYALEILYSGPVAGQLTVPACPTCQVRTTALMNRYFGTTCGGAGVPAKTIRLKPGNYQVVVRTSASDGPRPYSGSWKLAGGASYDNCYYASRAF
ncbi:hypothetical protein [Actinoplanes sp. NPDC026670]|uniref:hypothetical protein n=1 Tax=Actinoplanes sp. NPDC026670 TaxID=3154700 RepID=UPI00340411F6